MINWFKRRGTPSNSYKTNEDWIKALTPPPVEQAIEDLRYYLIKGLRVGMFKYVQRDLDAFVKDIVQDSILKIMDSLDSFRGESKFTTWAMKIAIRDGYTELRRKRYNDVSLSQFKEKHGHATGELPFKDNKPTPEQEVHTSLLLQKVLKIMDEELSEKQKKVMESILIEQKPMTIVADEMGSNRNAVYKMMHDARVKLKKRLEHEGMDIEQLLKEL